MSIKKNIKCLSFSASIALLSLSACTTTEPIIDTQSDRKPLLLAASSFNKLPGWKSENFHDFAQGYDRSCGRILKKNSQDDFGPSEHFGKYQEWQINCRRFDKINKTNPTQVRSFFEQNFTPYVASAGSNTSGLFTGYYEASLNGSRTKQGRYQTPLRARPDDLVMINLGEFREELKGQRIAGRVKDGRLKPYEDHSEIIAGGLPSAQDKALVWVDSDIDAFFLQIQGSGIVALEDGSLMRVGYAGQNGHPYYAIGRELVKRGELSKNNVSLQSIRAWLQTNPDQATEVMTQNKSYVFFTELDGSGPVGGEGVPLTPKRSLAVDHSLVPYGMPVWLEAEAPNDTSTSINKLMLTQDTGGAIRGPVRGDFFWGYGAEAEKQAGNMKSKGRYWFLMPKSL